MKQQLKLKNQEKFEKTKEENVQTVIETDTDLTREEVNVELAERVVTTTKEERIVDGEEKTLIDIDESKEVQKVSYPRPDKIYKKETKGLTLQSSADEEINEDANTVSQPKMVFIQVKIPKRKQFFPENFDSVEVADSKDLRPTVEFTVEDEESGEFIKQVQKIEFTDIIKETSHSSRKLEMNLFEDETTEYNAEEYEMEEEHEGHSDEIPIISEDLEEEYQGRFDELDIELDLEDEISKELVEESSQLTQSLDQFDGVEEHSFVSRGVLKAEYDSSQSTEGVSERVMVSLDSFGNYDSVTGSDVVEYLGSETGLDATVAEIPYFSENSGASWESGWNSFDMVLQMGDMNFQNMEYMISNIGEQRNTPAMQSIGSDFDSSKVLEFRESQEWSNHDGGYSASQETTEAWEEEYGQGIMELDDVERGIYAAIVEGNKFRGSEIDFTEMGLEHGQLLQDVYMNRENYMLEISPHADDKGLSTALS